MDKIPTGRNSELPRYVSDMTMREWYAGQALVGLISKVKTTQDVNDMPEACFKTADSMVAEGSKEGSET